MTDTFSATPALRRGEFRGNASEYFGIWIVNILLTIVTLGIYSAWAKVRRRRYFFGNTYVDGHSFDYHARGINLFIGRLFFIGYVLVYNGLILVSPVSAGIFAILFVFALPWLVQRSLRFNARVTSYRNVCFEFTGTVGGAFKAFLLAPLISILSLGFAVPVASRWHNKYVLNNLRYGDKAFRTDVTTGDLYKPWLVSFFVVCIGLMLATGFVFFTIYSGLESLSKLDSNQQIKILAFVYLAMVPGFLLLALAGFIYRKGVRNAVLSAAVFDDSHRMLSDISALKLLWIFISNTVVTYLTLGLMRPWAAVREYRYVMGRTGIRPQGELSTVVAAVKESGSAASSEFLDLEGFDFGF